MNTAEKIEQIAKIIDRGAFGALVPNEFLSAHSRFAAEQRKAQAREKALDILVLLQQGEPEGWKLVPVEPTVEQLEAMPSLPAIRLPVPENLKHLRPHQYQNRERYLAALSASPLPPAPGAETAEQEQDRFDADADSISSEVNHLPEVQSLPDLCSEDVWPHVERALVSVGRHFRRSKSNG